MSGIVRSLVECGVTLRLLIHSWYLTSLATQALAKVSAYDRLDPEQQVRAREETDRELADWVRRRLRTTPYWREGHRVLANLALQQRDFPLAALSAHALKYLSSEKSAWFAAALFFEARLALAQGKAQQAREILSQLLTRTVAKVPRRLVIEDLAAAHFACQEYTSAVERIESIAPHHRSSAAQSVLDFAKAKVTAQ